MIKKAWVCGASTPEECSSLDGMNLCTSRDKCKYKKDIPPFALVPTPYFNALRGVARANKMLCKKLDQIFSNQTYKAIFTLAFSHGLSYKGQPECSKELKQAKDATAKLEKEEKKTMKPVNFAEKNCVYAENQPEYLPLPVYKQADGEVWSCWKLTWCERFKVLFTGCFWLGVMTFNQPLQPLRPLVDNPFNPKTWQKLAKEERK